ncbi:glycoside hydrolase family 32 protein [Streptomyces sp. ISL-36]|nr:glycoside hydrolase family 32 protein [Streptomyces sp. ISL-36]
MDDPHFPAIHLRPPAHWVNDPNGLVFHDGHYHVFFQYNPHSARHADMHWGHFRSADLLHWEPMPVALAPTPGGDDEGGVWSGNAVEADDGSLVAFYSARHPDRRHQPVTSAVSYDGGTTFTKRGRLLIADPPEGTTMFRDPFVWREASGWRMLVGASLADGRGAALEYASADLERWEYRGVFLARPPHPLPGGLTTEEGWECAQYASFPGGAGAVLVSAWDPKDGAQCAAVWPGRDRDGEFVAEDPQLLDHGPDFYAPAVLPAPDGRWLLWAWIWEARDEEYVGAPSTWTDEMGWAGMLTLPRELTLGEDGSVRQQLARELLALRGGRRVTATGTAHPDRPSDLGEISRCSDVTVSLERGGRLRLLTSPDGGEYLDIVHDAATGEVVVDRAHASADPRAKGGARRLPAEGRHATLRIVFDHSVAEVFTASGRSLTLRFYPLGEGPWRLQAGASGVPSAAYTVAAWDLAAPAPAREEA